jgi:hypothetical protein
MLTPVIEKLLTLSDHRVLGERQIHPEADEANRQTKELCQRYGIELPYIDEYNTMTAYMFPSTSVERLVATNLWLDYLWFIDDSYDRNKNHEYSTDELMIRRIFEMSVRILCDGAEPSFDHVLFPVSQAIHEEFSRLAHPEWLQKRFKFYLLHHLKASTYKIEDILTDGKVDVQKYMDLREVDSGMYAAIMLIELAFDIYLPDEVMQHPQIQHLIRLCARICTFSNDLFSYEKEVIRLHSDFNLLKVLMDSRGLNFDEAVHESITIVNQLSEEFLNEEQKLPDFGNENLNRMARDFVQGLKDHSISAYHWQMSTNRYRSPSSPFPELREMLP